MAPGGSRGKQPDRTGPRTGAGLPPCVRSLPMNYQAANNALAEHTKTCPHCPRKVCRKGERIYFAALKTTWNPETTKLEPKP